MTRVRISTWLSHSSHVMKENRKIFSTRSTFDTLSIKSSRYASYIFWLKILMSAALFINFNIKYNPKFTFNHARWCFSFSLLFVNWIILPNSKFQILCLLHLLVHVECSSDRNMNSQYNHHQNHLPSENTYCHELSLRIKAKAEPLCSIALWYLTTSSLSCLVSYYFV